MLIRLNTELLNELFNEMNENLPSFVIKDIVNKKGEFMICIQDCECLYKDCYCNIYNGCTINLNIFYLSPCTYEDRLESYNQLGDYIINEVKSFIVYLLIIGL